MISRLKLVSGGAKVCQQSIFLKLRCGQHILKYHTWEKSPVLPGMLRMKWVTVCFDSLTRVSCNHVTYECSKCRDTSPVAGDGWPGILAMASSCPTIERFVYWIAWNLTGEDYFSMSDSYPLSTKLIVCNSTKYFRWTIVKQPNRHLAFHLHWLGLPCCSADVLAGP